jgi:beta-aspartyl-dipeptidase (metallo-type)
VTSNVAKVLKLKKKGKLGLDMDAELSVFSKSDFELKHLVSQGKCLVKHGRVMAKPAYLEKTNRHTRLEGEKDKEEKKKAA